jgi:glycosyltransferase involved in cell wall biosynthesis
MAKITELHERNMKNVLMVAHSFPPFCSVGHSIRVVKFIKYLPTMGWWPSVLTVDDRKEYLDYQKQGSESLFLDIPQDVTIFRTFSGEPSLNYLERERVFGLRNWLSAVIVKILGGTRRWILRNIALPDRRVAWLPFAVRRGRQIIKKNRIDVIFATCPPHAVSLVGVFLKIITGKPLILDFRDDWVNTPWYYSKPKIIRMINRKLERWAAKKADKVVLVTDWSRNAFTTRYSTQPKEKFILISNGCDLQEIAKIIPKTVKIDKNIFTILHAGALNESKSWGRNPAGLFQALGYILQEQPDLAERLTLVFAGDFPDAFRKLADQMGLSNVIKGIGHLPHDEVLRLIKSADLLLAINYDDFSTIIPAKIYEYWAVGGPPILLLSCPGAATCFVERHRLGISVDPLDVAGIQRAIMTVYLRSQTTEPMRINTVGIEAYDRLALTRKLVQVLSMVCRPCEF